MGILSRYALVLLVILMLQRRGASGTPVSMLVQWLSPRSWADSFTEEKDTVLSVVAMVPFGSIITIAAVKHDSIENIATFTTNSSADDMLLGILHEYDTTENSIFVNTSLMRKNVHETFPQHGQQMAEIVVIVCSDVTLMGPVSSILSTETLKKTLVVKVGDFRSVDPWLDVATDADHVLFASEHDKLMKVLQKDFTLACDINLFWDDTTQECHHCDMVCPKYRSHKCISEDIAFECQYFLHFVKQQQQKETSTKNEQNETKQSFVYQDSKLLTISVVVFILVLIAVVVAVVVVAVVAILAFKNLERLRRFITWCTIAIRPLRGEQNIEMVQKSQQSDQSPNNESETAETREVRIHAGKVTKI
ncbi:uncharacterized protein LOC128242426 isoform X2 [Mya arenaria]|uniref:uncharacterized protein LOC128242426 isoform X2 n=1 Tax=Mya arenaria TaxID=6604 RepID=UPI0022DF4FAF|nr:uncharacterized protein LOC128242426 isoform X2 [Mya arenaria]